MADTKLCEKSRGGCGAAVEWRNNVRTGKPAMVNVVPDPNGNIQLVGDQQYRVLTKLQRNAAQQGDLMAGPAELFTLHFASCPNAENFRRCKRCHKTPCRCA